MVQPAPQPQVSDPDEGIDLDQLIEQVVPDAAAWKLAPNPLLGGERPADLINTPRAQVLRDMLRAAKAGMVS